MAPHKVPDFNVPVIDLTAYLHDPKSTDATVIVEQIRAACATSGFFQLVGHGVTDELQKGAFAAAKAFFSLPEDEKMKLRSKPGRGYEVIGTQFLEPGKQADLKEGYFVGPEVEDSYPPYRAFHEPNVWPTADQVADTHFKTPLIRYHQAVLALSFTVMEILATGMDNMDTSVFAQFCQDPIASLRLLHYPPHPDSKDETLVGTGAHTDFGAITLLLQDGNSGLQVLNNATKEWVDVEPRTDAYVVNVGDMLEVWTGGAYKSNIHRVINKSGADRYSMPFFLDGNSDTVIQPLNGLQGCKQGRSFTVEEHMLSRYAASYKGGNAA